MLIFIRILGFKRELTPARLKPHISRCLRLS